MLRLAVSYYLNSKQDSLNIFLNQTCGKCYTTGDFYHFYLMLTAQIQSPFRLFLDITLSQCVYRGTEHPKNHLKTRFFDSTSSYSTMLFANKSTHYTKALFIIDITKFLPRRWGVQDIMHVWLVYICLLYWPIWSSLRKAEHPSL